jgi:DNA-binding response OmpR family regulator
MNHRILIVTSDLALATALDLEIESGDVTIQVCRSKGAKDEATKWQPEVVIIDGTLLGKESLKVCRRLKHSKQLGSIPVLILNNLINSRLMSAAYKAGADFYILKQLEDHRALLLTLQTLFGMQKQEAIAA